MQNTIPTHVTIIMDGNGRWAEAHGKKRLEGHFEGIESARECSKYAVEVGIKYLSLFAFSTENWNRPMDEVLGLMDLMSRCVHNERSWLLDYGVRFIVIGDKERLSPLLRKEISLLEEETSSNTRMTLMIMLNYSGKWDIMQAAERYAREEGSGQGLDERKFSSYLSTAGIPDPDFMIRTSGEQRISNYMLWQCAYTEFYFTETLWPDFRKEEFHSALQVYAGRQRRFGKTEVQVEE